MAMFQTVYRHSFRDDIHHSARTRLPPDIATFPTRDEAPVPVTAEPKKIELTRADVNAIIERTRTASPEELQHIISHAREYALTTGERNQLGCDLSITVAHRARQLDGRREDPNERFIAETLGLISTPFGLVERSFIAGLLRDGARNIARCRRHQPPSCECWSSQRVVLWQAQSVHGDRSPESWAAVRVRQALEDLELSSRPERGPGVM
jgi:hypothetical protein